MTLKYHPIILFFLFASIALFGDLMDDLLIVDYWNQKINERMPVTYNHLLQGGYFNMPSARMGCEGEIGLGFAYVKPYDIYSARCQLTDRIELSGNYRVFKGVEDPVLSPYGFGDFSDKGANIKLSILRPEDSDYTLPGLAIGWEDFLGTKGFEAKYIVMTQVLLDWNLEISLGYGSQRIQKWFGGVLWMPFRQTECDYFKNIAFVMEKDAIAYEDKDLEPHPKGREKKSCVNYGMKYRLGNHFDFSLSYIRGKALSFSASAHYNFGYTKGFITKIHDPLPYCKPVNRAPSEEIESEDFIAHDLTYAFRCQGYDVLDVNLIECENNKQILRLTITNEYYRDESDIRCRINHLLAYFVPPNIDEVIIGVNTYGFTIHEYRYPMKFVRFFRDGKVCPYELSVVSPLREVTQAKCDETNPLYFKKRSAWNFFLAPKTHTFFGSSTGKFKYSLGVNVGSYGYIFNDVYYTFLLGYNIISDLTTINDMDRLNPSQIVNVRTDIVNYFKQKNVTIDQAWLQKNWHIYKGWYARLSLGLFEVEYGGIASEILYYPVNSPLAFGIEGAFFKKRTYDSYGFTDKVRKLDGFTPEYKKFTFSQYFFDIYYNWKDPCLDFKFQIGKFLANDTGVRTEISRYFPSGMRVGVWYTRTNAKDYVNGHRYFDKGAYVSVPFDIFLTKTSQKKWRYGLSAWLRDVGVRAETGQPLYYLIQDQRYTY